MSLRRALTAVVAFGFVFGPLGSYALGFRPEAFENRPLAARPDPSDGFSAFADLAPWAADHLPIRKPAVRAKAWSDFNLLGTLPPSGPPPVTLPRIQGPDGPLLRSLLVVRGESDYLYYGQDFDNACADGEAFARQLDRLALVARRIERSGRTVVFSVAPNKTAIVGDELPKVIPHGRCARAGIRQQNRTLDRYNDPQFLPLRQPLAQQYAAGTQNYWKQDTHWTTVGSLTYAQALAAKLDPALADRITVERDTRTQVSDLNDLIGLTAWETAPSAQLSTGAPAVPTADSETYDYYQPYGGVQKWLTDTDGALPGKTTLIGDSFTYYSLENLRPLFADGQFLWDRNTEDDQDFIEAIIASDTVIISTAQRNVTANKLLRPGFVKRLTEALQAD